MHWDFRLIRTVISGQSIYNIHRCFYESSSRKKVSMIENLPACISGVGALCMLQDIEEMTNAFEKPTIYIPEWNNGK